MEAVEKIPNSITKKKHVMAWSSRKYFIMALLCWTVGLGNCWRFPTEYMKANNYLIPYIIQAMIVGVPIAFMELGIGQFSSKGPIKVWALCPIWKGVSYGNVFILVICLVYCNVMCAYTMYYSILSVSSTLPWTTCDPSWAKINCYTFAENLSIRMECIQKHGVNFCSSLKWEHSGHQFWKYNVLNLNPVGSLQSVSWKVVYCSLTTLFLVFLINCKGTKSLERVISLLTVIPYLQMIALLLIALIDPGSLRGLKKLLTNNFENLLSIQAWEYAFKQIFFSVGLGMGGLIMLGSQCNFRNPVQWQAIIINMVDLGSSFCMGIIIYCTLGAMSYDLNIPIDTIIEWSDNLLFSKMPYAITYLGGIAQIWSLLFYTCVYFLGLRAEVMMVAVLLSLLYEHYPETMDHTILWSGAISLAVLLAGYPLVTNVGIYLIQDLDNVIVGPVICVVAFFELFGIIWLYGLTRFVDDMHFMLGFRLSAYWQIIWALTPFIGVILFSLSTHSFVKISTATPHILVRVIQWSFYVLPWLFLIITLLNQVIKKRNKITCSNFLKPSNKWGPIDPILRKSREMFSAHSMTKEYMYRQTRMIDKNAIYEDSDNLEDEDDEFSW